MEMTIQQVYEKYKHLDKVLTDENRCETFRGQMLYDFWQAIKREVEKRKD